MTRRDLRTQNYDKEFRRSRLGYARTSALLLINRCCA
jgi:hypothetical protein